MNMQIEIIRGICRNIYEVNAESHFFSFTHLYDSFIFVIVYKCSSNIADKVNIHLNFRAVERCLILISDVSYER